MSFEDCPHILVVDDDDRLRELLRKYLSDNGFFVVTANGADMARSQLATFAIDLIVLDVMMPGEDGLEFTARLRQNCEVPILLLTARGEPDDRIAGLESGADDYLAKPFEPRELVLRITSILRRAPRPTPSPSPAAAAAETHPGADADTAIRLGRWRYLPEREELRSPETDDVIRLTTAEAALLRVLATHPGTVFSREELAERMQGDINARTVDVQVTRLRRKIEADPRQPRFLHTVRGEGYVLRPE